MMKLRLNTRFADAIHTLSLIYVRSDQNINSTQIAGSVNTNPVVIRRLIADLKKANLVATSQGKAKIELVKTPNKITLLEIYEAVDDGHLLNVDTNTNLNCIIGGNIQSVLGDYYKELESNVKQQLAKNTLADMIDKILTNARTKEKNKNEQ